MVLDSATPVEACTNKDGAKSTEDQKHALIYGMDPLAGQTSVLHGL